MNTKTDNDDAKPRKARTLSVRFDVQLYGEVQLASGEVTPATERLLAALLARRAEDLRTIGLHLRGGNGIKVDDAFYLRRGKRVVGYIRVVGVSPGC